MKLWNSHFSCVWCTEPVKCAHRTQPIPCGVIVSVCLPMVWNVAFWRPIVWFPAQVYRCAKTIKWSSMWRITWKAWRRHCIGTVSINVAHSTTMVCHLWPNVPSNREIHSGKCLIVIIIPDIIEGNLSFHSIHADTNGLATQALISGTRTLASRRSTVSMAASSYGSHRHVIQIRIYTISIWRRTLFWSAIGCMKMPPNDIPAVWL